MDKIVIYTESKFLPEKRYVLQVILGEILGLEYEVFDTSVSQVYKFVMPNGNFIEFADEFFTYIPESIGYCNKKYLPTKVAELKNVLKDDVPFLYGNNRLTNHGSSMYCGGDIIGSAFFMLSRWEETIAENYDNFGRFSEKEACAVRFGIIDKPVVHIYAELVRAFLKEFDIDVPQRHKYKKIISHDVDCLYKWGNTLDFIKSCMGDLFKRFSIRSFQTSLQMRKSNQDPYDTFNFLMDLSEKNNQKSIFYFLYTKRNEWQLGTEKGKQIINAIKDRKHEIGIHSNYFLEVDFERIKADQKFYETIFNRPLVKNRQHYLKIRVPQTFRALEEIGITQDSSLYYPHFPGFRTGMCIEHSLFDCETRKVMKIKELPLTLMDVSLQDARKYKEAEEWVDSLMDTVKRYHGSFVCLWHNSSFYSMEWKYLDGLYTHIVEDR